MLFIYTLSRILAYKLGLYHSLLLNLFAAQYSWINNTLSEKLLAVTHLPLYLCKTHTYRTYICKATVMLVKRKDFQHSFVTLKYAIGKRLTF